ncbi:hypothetical protein KJ359_003147 [Pestalotiopsis sp. 9143b]|nr:hypothetical protein KJ359_003147 [Pestalotiopsis sp. 9143b]
MYSQQDGFYAAAIRHHDNEFWVVCEFLGLPDAMYGTIFRSADPHNDSNWSNALTFETITGDLDLFWDDDGKLYIPAQGAVLQELDLDKGEITSRVDLWSGTGGVWPEGPHLYRKDDWYYISLAEGGTETGHYQVMARSRNLTGPYDPCPYNPVLTNKGTDEYFQTVAHADLFQDSQGNWWGVALATRSGPEWSIYPMGRETVLYPVTWLEGEWPILEPVRGKMSGWELPPTDRTLPGEGPYNSDPDFYAFPPGSRIPENLIYWRAPREGSFSVATEGGLRISPSRCNLTGDGGDLDGRTGLSFIGRRQTHSLFSFRVDMSSDAAATDHEAGVTLFLTQKNHVDLAVKNVEVEGVTERVLTFRVTSDEPVDETTTPVPVEWGSSPINFEISTINATHYQFTASAAEFQQDRHLLGVVSGRVISGQSGPFTGALVGVYATCNGAGSGLDCPAGGDVYLWTLKYTGIGQYYTATDLVPL